MRSPFIASLGLASIIIGFPARHAGGQSFDSLFTGQEPVVLQGNFGAVKTPAGGLRREFSARLFGKGTAKFTLKIQTADARLEIRPFADVAAATAGSNGEFQFEVTPKDERWYWEARFSVPTGPQDTDTRLSITVGPDTRKFILGDVWLFAGSPNLLVGAETELVATGVNATQTKLPPAQPTPGQPEPQEPAPPAEPSVAGSFVAEYAKITRRPAMAYILAQSRTVLDDWKLDADKRFWDVLNGSGGGTPVATRGLVWWHGEWQAEDPRLGFPVEPTTLETFEQGYLDGLISKGGAAPSGLLVEVPARLNTGRNLDGTSRPDAASTKAYGRVVVQTQAVDRLGKQREFFPFGESAGVASPAWATYERPESTWARLRCAELNAIAALRELKPAPECGLVAATGGEEKKPARWIWKAAADRERILDLARLMAAEARRQVLHGEAAADDPNAPPPPGTIPADVPKFEFDTKILTLPEADPAATALREGKAKFELLPKGEKWVPAPTPALAGGKLNFGAQAGEIVGIRYGFGDDPGKLHEYPGAKADETHLIAPFCFRKP
jgi:hypothetical protein